MARRLALVGTGLIGASIGLAARAAGMEVIGTDVDPGAAVEARARGALDATAADVPALLAAAVPDAVLAIAVPLDATVALLERLAAEPPALALAFDVASVKVPVAKAGAALPWFVPTHPLAGSERSGPAAARADLFAGRTWAYEPNAPAAPAVRDLIASFGADPVAVDAATHDRIVAATSHLPQLLAVALGQALSGRLGEAEVRALSGPGLRSSLRLASSSWTVWRSVLMENAVPVAQEVRALAAILSEVADDVAARRGPSLEARFLAAARAVAALDENGEAQDPVLPADHRQP